MATVRMLTPYQLNYQFEETLNNLALAIATQLEGYNGKLAPYTATSEMKEAAMQWIKSFEKEVPLLQHNLQTMPERFLLKKECPNLFKKIENLHDLRTSFEIYQLIQNYKKSKEMLGRANLKQALEQIHIIIHSTLEKSLVEEIRTIMDQICSGIAEELKEIHDEWMVSKEVLGNNEVKEYLAADFQTKSLNKELNELERKISYGRLNPEEKELALQHAKEIKNLFSEQSRILSDRSFSLIQDKPCLAAILTRLTYPDEGIEVPLQSRFGPLMRSFIIIFETLYGQEMTPNFFKTLSKCITDKYVNSETEKVKLKEKSRIGLFKPEFNNSPISKKDESYPYYVSLTPRS